MNSEESFMKRKALITVAVLAMAIGFSAPAYSQSTMVDGQVTKIDESAG